MDSDRTLYGRAGFDAIPISIVKENPFGFSAFPSSVSHEMTLYERPLAILVSSWSCATK